MFESSLTNPAFADAWADYQADRVDAAYDKFAQLFRSAPLDTQINMAYALAAKKAGRYSHAALMLDRVLKQQPENHRAALELAENYYLMKQYDLAREQFETVLAVNPPDAVRENIVSYMRLIERRTQRWRSNVQFSAGMFHDDNVNVGPVDALISIEPIRAGSIWIDTLSVDSESKPQEAWGAYGALSLSGEYDVGRKRGWQAYGRANAYQSALDDHNEYEMGYYQLALGMRLEKKTFLFQLPARAEHVIRGHDTLVNIFGAMPTLLYAVTPQVQLISVANGEYRDYEGNNTDYSGAYFSLGETVRWFWGQRRNSVGVGLRGIRDSADSDEYSHWGCEGSLTADYRLFNKTIVYGLGQLRFAKYDERPVLAASDREDDQWIAACGVNQGLTSEWDMNINYRYTRNHSNFDLYTYRRHVISLSTSYSF